MLSNDPLLMPELSARSFGTVEAFSATIVKPYHRRTVIFKLARFWILLVSDLLGCVSALACGYFLWARPALHQTFTLYTGAMPLLALLPFTYWSAGLYPGFGLGAVETLRRLSKCSSISFLTLAALSFVLKTYPPYSRTAFAVAWLASLGLVPLFRFGVLSRASTLRWWGEPTVIVGPRSRASLTIRSLKHAFSLGYHVVGVISPDEADIGTVVEGIPVLGGVSIARNVARRGVNTALIWDSPEVNQSLPQLHREFRHLVIISDNGGLPIEHARLHNLGGVLGIEFTEALTRKSNQILKRIIDLGLASICLLAALPLIALAGLLIVIADPGPVFFEQVREGLGGRKIKVLKLRTMYQNAETRFADLLRDNPHLREKWQAAFKLGSDPRVIPKVGAFLRRFSIDELPQLWTVLMGEMSLVGPRPFPEYHLQALSPEFRSFRRIVRPGLTGLWQVMVRGDGDLDDQIFYDSYYISNWSLSLDFYLLVRTCFAVLGSRGAY